MQIIQNFHKTFSNFNMFHAKWSPGPTEPIRPAWKLLAFHGTKSGSACKVNLRRGSSSATSKSPHLCCSKQIGFRPSPITAKSPTSRTRVALHLWKKFSVIWFTTRTQLAKPSETPVCAASLFMNEINILFTNSNKNYFSFSQNVFRSNECWQCYHFFVKLEFFIICVRESFENNVYLHGGDKIIVN